MKLVVDENIPYATDLFSLLGNVVLRAGRTINSGDLQDADALIIRSVTRVDRALLETSNVQFVGSSTIGTDHVDLKYLKDRNVRFASAPGCNANAVVQYVVCALSQLNSLVPGKRVAVIGCGNVGRRVFKALDVLGLHCIGIDPYVDEGSLNIKSFESIYDADIICMHTPLVKGGLNPTLDLIDYDVLTKLKPGIVLLNAGRGECINNKDLLRIVEEGKSLRLVLDVWANEPNMDAQLFPHVCLGTPHIAGYSFEGKIVGATMIFSELARILGKSDKWVSEKVSAFESIHLGASKPISFSSPSELFRHVYDIQKDHSRLDNALEGLPASFDKLRKSYPMRRDFSHYAVGNISFENLERIQGLGFKSV